MNASINDLNNMILSSDPFARTATFDVREAVITADTFTHIADTHDFDTTQGYGENLTYWSNVGECYGA